MSARRRDASVLGLALTLLLIRAGTAGTAEASSVASSTPTNGTVAAKTTSGGRTAPSGPPLTSPLDDGGAEGTAGVPSLEGDQLVENGLSSPLCDGAKAPELSNTAQSNCQTSGFVGAPAPTNNYDLDVNIGTGTLGIGNGQLLSVIQDVFIAPVWEGLVWLVHALVVMLQWCYTLELLGGSTTSGLRDSLREAQTSFTEPWLALVLAVASVLALYNGLIRRRVAETLGQALLTIAMMACRAVVDRQPAGYRRRRRSVRQSGQSGNTRRGCPGHDRKRPTNAWRQHAGAVCGRDRSALVLPGVRRRALVQRSGDAGTALAQGGIEHCRRRAGQARLPAESH